MNSTQMSLDRVFDLLADRRRRYVLYHLAEADERAVLDLGDVADRVVEREREWHATRNSEPPDTREAVRIDLHHNDLPRLADAGLVDYDARTATIRNWDTLLVERWVPDESDELPHLRALFAVDDSTDGDSTAGDSVDGGSTEGGSSDGDAR